MEDFKLSDVLERYVIEMRRDFHRHPELSLAEVRTSGIVREELEKFGIPYEIVGDQNVIGILDFGGEGSLAIRADMDALPIREETDVAWKSENEGIMHACGHDGHTAILLGVARVLSEQKAALDIELDGKVYLCFQQAEEAAGGAQPIVEFLKEKGGVDHAICIHLMSVQESGTIDISEGLRANGACLFQVEITGVGGHGSQPDRVVNVLEIACDVYQHLIKIPVNHHDSNRPCVVSPCTIHAGNRFNVFPDKAYIEGTIRYSNRGDGDVLQKKVTETAEKIAALYGGKAHVTFEAFAMSPIINDKKSSEIGAAAGRAAGFEVVCGAGTAGSDNFCEFLDIAPGFYALVGSASSREGTSGVHHTANFDLDESVLGKTVLFFCECTKRFLNKQ
ncbi:MAG: amidohydrolase [Clostridiales Family XIII bacterium]|jgi:amidohydrolase|nr:amidohydrolase [Clostridiales Family XIII bacterium]